MVNSPPGFILQGLLEGAIGAPLPQLEQIEAKLKRVTLDRGGTVFAQDAVHPYLYAVRRGLIKLAYLDAAGDEWIKSFIAEGQFFASMAALAPGGRTTFMAVALENAELERIPYADIAALADTHLAWSRAVNALTLVYAARKEQRERELLTLSAEERYEEFARQYPGLLERVPQKELARHLGLTPVGLNRIVGRVRRRG